MAPLMDTYAISSTPALTFHQDRGHVTLTLRYALILIALAISSRHYSADVHCASRQADLERQARRAGRQGPAPADRSTGRHAAPSDRAHRLQPGGARSVRENPHAQ